MKRIKAFIVENKLFSLFFLGMAVYYAVSMFAIKPWYDELYTYYSFISRGPVYAAIHWPVPNNHVFYSVLSAFLDYLGNSYIGLRGVSFLMSCANMLLLYQFAKKFLNRFFSAGVVFLVCGSLAGQQSFGAGTRLYTCGNLLSACPVKSF